MASSTSSRTGSGSDEKFCKLSQLGILGCLPLAARRPLARSGCDTLPSSADSNLLRLSAIPSPNTCRVPLAVSAEKAGKTAELNVLAHEAPVSHVPRAVALPRRHALTRLRSQPGNVHRKLKSRHLQMIALGGTIGTGVYLNVGATLNEGGPVGLVLGSVRTRGIRNLACEELG